MWGDGKGLFYKISIATHPVISFRQLPDKSEIQKVYDAGGVSAVWSIGGAFCKVKILDTNATREHITLRDLHNRPSLSFVIPEVHYQAEHDGRYYIILSGLPGQTLDRAWPIMEETTKQHYVSRVTSICKELAVWHGRTVSGVDGKHLSDQYLTRKRQPTDCSPETLLKNCEDLTMDCSTLMFYHCDLGPGNIIVDVADGSIGIIDWETAGFVPIEWIRTKFSVSSGMDLFDGDVDWRRRVSRQLGHEGYPEIADRWMTWRSNK